ncbi:MAG: methyltransferase domain-containing protein [Myxococcales bacterium]|nr:methyltransferase domain-containing protein [Myxococcales bacterium]
MEIRAFKVRAHAGHVRVLSVDVQGATARDLEGSAAEAVIAAARPLFELLADELGAPLRALSYDDVDQVLRVTPAARQTIAPGRLAIREPDLDPHVPGLQAIARAIAGELRRLDGDPRQVGGEPPSPGDPGFWESLYQRGFTGWELGRPAPPLARHFAVRSPRGLRALVIGCGRGNEARMLAEAGAEVTAIDISATAIREAEAHHAGPPITFKVADLFDLRGQPPAYDLVVEHTCFCAIDPARRDDFVDAVAAALRPGGALVGLFYAHGRPGGPPFTTDAAELRRRFDRAFVIEALETARGSVITRRGDELLGRLIRRGGQELS